MTSRDAEPNMTSLDGVNSSPAGVLEDPHMDLRSVLDGLE
jgi:hypothetical protein